jgi:hypothetical protein
MILVPAMSLDDWRRLLASRDSKEGYSAHTLATRWHASPGFPPEISALLATNDLTSGATLLLAIPEHQVPLAGGARASQTDLWALARTARGLVSVAVDGNASESFGPSIGDWEKDVTSGKRARWEALCELLEVNRDCDRDIRYRLFHRTASALLEAKRFHAKAAAVVVHSFSATREFFGDFQRFVRLMGGNVAAPGQMMSVPAREGIALCFGWAQG